MKSSTLLKIMTVFLSAVVPVCARSQADTWDLSAGGGLADYLGGGDKDSAKGLVDVSLVYNLAPRLGFGIQYTYSPVATVDESFTGYIVTGSAHLDHYGLLARVPFAATERAEPYAGAHLGLVHEIANYSGFGSNVGTTQYRSFNGGYAGVSAGVNLFVAHNFGVRPEVRYDYLRVNQSNISEIDVTGSVFYRFGGSRK